MRYLSLWAIFISIYGHAQTVETVTGPSPKVNNGLVVHPNGNIYASDLFGNGFDGTRIYKITPDGTSEFYAGGLTRPAGLVFDLDHDLLYVAEFSSGEISRIDTQGKVTRFVSGLQQPSGLVFDTDTNLYVTNYGNGTVSRITPKGQISTLTSGLNQPVGIAIHNNTLYVANLKDGKIYEIDLSGKKKLIATIKDVPVGFMTYSRGSLFVNSTGKHKIYEIDLDGNVVSLLTGTGRAGTVNGDLGTAQFTSPDGIAASPTGDTLYVSENTTNLLRRIILGRATNLSENELVASNLKVFPNPIVDEGTIQFQADKNGDAQIAFYTNNGKLLKQVHQGYLHQGSHTFQLDAKGLPPGLYLCQVRFLETTLETKVFVTQ